MEEKKSNQKYIGIMILVALIIAAGSFYSGMLYSGSQKSATAIERNGAGFANGARTGGANRGMVPGGGQGAGFVNGSVIKQDDKTITVQLRDGGSKIIYISDKTTVGKTVDGTKADLGVGKNVMVNGKVNTDGSVVAENVQIRPDVVPGALGVPGSPVPGVK